jgi:hypothetical protein
LPEPPQRYAKTHQMINYHFMEVDPLCLLEIALYLYQLIN